MNKSKQSRFYIGILYFLFAVFATLINIGIQKGLEVLLDNFLHCSFYNVKIYNSFKITIGLLFQMIIATIVAFIFKYIVDKLYIFKDKTIYFTKEHIKQVILYGLFAVVTTLIFWGIEIIFKTFIESNNSQYIGAVVGLSIGYTLKFLLDRKYVFLNKK